ncbi:MAG: alpha/beta hydrolase [Sphingomonas fennica]
MDTPLLLLPGLLCDDAVFAAQIDAFPGRAVTVADYGMADTIGAMAAAALAQAPARFALMGHSMGARVALEVWRMAPERVERLALVSTGIHPVSAGEPAKRHRLVDLARAEGMAALCAAWLPPMVAPARHADAALMAPMEAMVLRQTPDRFAAQIAALLARPEAEAVLASVTVPLLVAVGDQDAWSPPVQHEAMAALVPGARLVVFSGSGHMAPCEVPDQVNAALAGWLAMPAAA